ncbi:MAG: DHH family phosphoesterase [Bdellovibrionales bacterium]|nr:DHH family phosphoesterase [Bdellovibrionales bacterium]
MNLSVSQRDPGDDSASRAKAGGFEKRSRQDGIAEAVQESAVASRKQVHLPDYSTAELAKRARAAHRLVRASDELHPKTAEVLVNRGVTTSKALDQYQHETWEEAFRDFGTIKGIDTAAEIVSSAIVRREKIALAHDYDVDGACSFAILSDVCQRMGAPKCKQLAANRYGKHGGYGLTKDMVDRALRSKAKLLIAMDIGATQHDVVDYAKSKGLKVVIIDHHRLSRDPQTGALHAPNADAFVDPMQPNCGYGDGDLCAAQLTFFTALRIREALSKCGEEYIRYAAEGIDSRRLIQMAGLALVADQMKVVGKNRAFLREALHFMNVQEDKKDPNSGPIPAVRALKYVSNIKRKIEASDLGFEFGPRLNAPGRMVTEEGPAGVELATNLLLRKRFDRATVRLAEKITGLNVRRRKDQRLAEEKALAHFQSLPAGTEALVFADETLHPGVIGPAAASVAENLNIPVILLTNSSKGSLTGSARAPDSGNPSQEKEKRYDIEKLLSCAAHCVTHYGGHEGAGGVRLAQKQLDEFIAAIQRGAKEQRTPEVKPFLVKPDTVLTIEELLKAPKAIVNGQKILEPCGRGNPGARYLFENMFVFGTEVTPKGHLEVTFRQGDGSKIKATLFFTREHPILRDEADVHVIAKPYLYRREKHSDEYEVRLRILAASPVETAGA